MRVPASLAAVALTGAIGAATAAQPPSSTPAFPSGAEAVTVDVVVLDKDGTPVTDLTREDFTVEEDGVAQSVTAFESIAAAPGPPAPAPGVVTVEVARPAVSSNARPERPGRTLVVVFDDTHLTPIRGEAARKAVTRFLDAARTGDRVTLVPTSGGTWWTTVLPQGADDLAGALERLQGLRVRDTSARQMSDFEALRIYRYRDERVRSDVYTRLIEMDQIGDTDSGRLGNMRGLQIAPGKSLVDAMAASIFIAAEQRMKITLELLERVLASLGGQRGRKTVLLVSEGFVHDTQIEGFARVARRASEVNAEVDFVDARSLEADLPAMAEAEIRQAANPTRALGIIQRARMETQGAESIALDTGGLVVRGGNDLEGALRRAADASRAYYLLGYQPTNPARNGKFRRIELKLRRPGLTVRARKGYYAPRAEKEPLKADAIDPDVQRALDAPEPTANIPMRLAAYRLGPAAGGKTKVRLTAELDPGALGFVPEGDRSRDTLDTFFLVASRETGGRESHQTALDLNLPGGRPGPPARDVASPAARLRADAGRLPGAPGRARRQREAGFLGGSRLRGSGPGGARFHERGPDGYGHPARPAGGPAAAGAPRAAHIRGRRPALLPIRGDGSRDRRGRGPTDQRRPRAAAGGRRRPRPSRSDSHAAGARRPPHAPARHLAAARRARRARDRPHRARRGERKDGGDAGAVPRRHSGGSRRVGRGGGGGRRAREGLPGRRRQQRPSGQQVLDRPELAHLLDEAPPASGAARGRPPSSRPGSTPRTASASRPASPRARPRTGGVAPSRSRANRATISTSSITSRKYGRPVRSEL